MIPIFKLGRSSVFGVLTALVIPQSPGSQTVDFSQLPLDLPKEMPYLRFT